MNRIAAANLYRYDLPLTEPLSWAEQRQQRSGAIVELTFADGQRGWGEIAPLPGFSQESLAQAIDSARYHLRRLIEGESLIAPEPSVAFAIDCAQQQINFATAPTQRAMLLQGQPADILEQVEGFPNLPRCVKLKVARAPLQQEQKLMQALLDQMPVTEFRLDANRQWSFEQALSFCRAVDMSQVSFIEEPCDTLAASVCLGASGYPIALDEHLQDPLFMPTAFEGLSALVIKPSLVGGLARCQELVNWAKQNKIKVIVSASYESSLGTSQLATLAEQWSPQQLPGLDTLHYLQPHTLPSIPSADTDAAAISPAHWHLIWQS
ncbi:MULTISPECIES: o-succinylbenzoate synthase [Corallincola]|uniref:o-succinylbenzoate synthase n=3 Tax=Corallincola TaxID=1775176 RepID=A0A368NHD8_9GAMM|nr:MULTISPECIES: o-succinylbenzoate synthase [Corallincola]RCU49982.1 o-succinylbenzoate synthase [Corallincola holothuriorum]TAA45040.1 o-succinylbenzoate synthase [Corallincola spongiicola]TCI03681.1 o-succinylbenzoate synthase [Corallincola luteus]